MAKKRIILTVPHGCSKDTPVCDEKADQIAERTFQLLVEEEIPIEVHLLTNRTSRNKVDMNRPEGRGTEFRNRIDELVKEHNVLLFDVHSFPFYSLGYRGVEVGVFNLPKKADDVFAKEMVQQFADAGFKTKEIQGAQENDIAQCLECNETDEAVLLEFNQKMEVEATAKRVVEVIKKVLEKEG